MKASYLSDQKKAWLAMEAAQQSDKVTELFDVSCMGEPHLNHMLVATTAQHSRLFKYAHLMDLAVSDLVTAVLVLMTLSHKQPI